MKVDAHPLLVAVALGLLGPGVLDNEDESDRSLTFRASEREVPRETLASDWEPGPAPAPEELHRVELEWNAAVAEWSSSKT